MLEGEKFLMSSPLPSIQNFIFNSPMSDFKKRNLNSHPQTPPITFNIRHGYFDISRYYAEICDHISTLFRNKGVYPNLATGVGLSVKAPYLKLAHIPIISAFLSN